MCPRADTQLPTLVTFSLERLSDKELLSLLPVTIDEDEIAPYLAGVRIGLLNRRAVNERDETEVLRALHDAMTANDKYLASESFSRGIAAGFELRMNSERIASELHKRVLAVIPLKFIRRLLTSFRNCSSVLEFASGIERALVAETYSLRFERNLVRDVYDAFGARKAGMFVQMLMTNSKLNVLTPGETPPSTNVEFTGVALDSAIKSGSPWIGRFFAGRTSLQRKALVEDYENKFGPLEPRLEKIAPTFEHEILVDLVRNGRVSWSKLLFFCVVGVGTDEDGLRELFEEITVEELELARKEFRVLWESRAPWYERPFPNLFGNLETRIWLETGGDSWFDLKEYFITEQNRSRELHDRLFDLHRHEQSGLLLKRLDVLSRTGSLMNRDAKAVRAFYESHKNDLSGNAAVRLRFNGLIRYAELDCELFRAVKHHMGNHGTNLIATAAVALAVFALTSQKLDLVTVMTCTGLVSIGCRIVLKTMLKGRGYHRGEVGADIFFGVFDGLTLFTTHLFRQALIQFGMRTVTKLGVTNGVSRMSRLMGSRRNDRWGLRFRGLAGPIDSLQLQNNKLL